MTKVEEIETSACEADMTGVSPVSHPKFDTGIELAEQGIPIRQPDYQDKYRKFWYPEKIMVESGTFMCRLIIKNDKVFWKHRVQKRVIAPTLQGDWATQEAYRSWLAEQILLGGKV